MLRVLDLFSGIGGFSLGLERTGGFETVAFCEIEEYPQKVLRKHWPDVPIYDDVRELSGEQFRGAIDVICGGFPCTQTSVAAAIHGKREGLRGAASGLWYEYLRLVRTIRPVWVIIENPSGVTQWEGEIQGSLERLGYRVSRLESKAVDCGLPHIRKRYFYIANTNGQGLAVARRSQPCEADWITRLATAGGAWLTGTPGTVGIYNGLPHRVDRVRCLGNAVVPQVVQVLGQAILKAEAERRAIVIIGGMHVSPAALERAL